VASDCTESLFWRREDASRRGGGAATTTVLSPARIHLHWFHSLRLGVASRRVASRGCDVISRRMCSSGDGLRRRRVVRRERRFVLRFRSVSGTICCSPVAGRMAAMYWVMQPAVMPPAVGGRGIKRYRVPSVRLSVPWHSCRRRAAALGYWHAGCLQLSHVQTADPSADGSGISWTICKQSAPRSGQITTPTFRH